MRLASIAAVVVGSLAFAAAPALGAAPSHTFSTTFAGSGTNSLSAPTAVAVDQTSHDVYVTDPGNDRIEKFDSSGNFILMFGGGVDQTTGADVCTAASGDTCQAGSSGSAPGQFITPAFIATDASGGPSSGDVYVGDTGDNFVQKFDPSGHIVSNWGTGGQKDGSDATDLPIFGPLGGVGTDHLNGTLYILGFHYSTDVWKYTQSGQYVSWDNIGTGYFFTAGTPVSIFPGDSFDPANDELYQLASDAVDHYNTDCSSSCDLADSFGQGHLSNAQGVAVDGSTHTVYVANTGTNDVAVFGDARPIVTTGPPTNVTESSVTLTGHIDPAGRGDIASCHFEYGFDKTYGADVPCTPDPASSNFTAPTDVTATVTGLSPGTKDHYRLVATNAAGAGANGADQTFTTTQPPAIDGLTTANLTATSADINAQVNPNGLDTTYRFEYGTTTAYGQSAPIPDGTISASNSDQPIGVHLDNLVPHVVYHYRLLATNADGTTTSEDHTFNFFPPSCPNENVRQQAQADYLPDCRAYELVSPGDAAGTQLYPGGPNAGYATNPSRFSFTGLWSTIPGSGGSPLDGVGDLYVATRTDTGWVTRYIGLPASQAAVDGGPPQGLPGSGRTNLGLGSDGGGGLSNGGSDPEQIQSGVLTDPSMDTFLDWNDGNQSTGSSNGRDYVNPTPKASAAPYVFAADGALRDRWPTNLAAVPAGAYPAGSNLFPDAGYTTPGQQPLTTAPGGADALDCPYVFKAGQSARLGNSCPGDVTASADLSHFVFATEWNAFAPGGLLGAPGSVYDNDTAAATVAIASKTPAGDDIPPEPTDQAGDPLQIPAVSTDGSHILIAAGATGPCGSATCSTPPCPTGAAAGRCPLQPSHLYMRVDGALTYDVSQGHAVNYVGQTNDGAKVYFTTAQQLTPDDTDTSTDLYMWSEATNAITLISKGTGGAGNGDSCHAAFTTNCGVLTYSSRPYCQQISGLGGNCLSDNSIASRSGDIYFFSPEQLVGTKGLPNQENLYDYRNGALLYVATFTTGPFCPNFSGLCSDTPIARMQVSPDGAHMAFLTASPVTQYDNAGHLEMYAYDPTTAGVTCVSCLPSGAPPTSDVAASENGLFMTNDGRTAFTTDDALVHVDTNQGQDVYEYVDGHPQLITPGTGETQQGVHSHTSPGLVGVSADGRDIYFSTFNTLLSQDQNGLFLKFYDARAGGGFPAPPPPPGCTAADECHGAGSAAPAALANGTGAALGAGGNASPQTPARHHKKKHHKRSHKRHHARHNRRAAR